MTLAVCVNVAICRWSIAKEANKQASKQEKKCAHIYYGICEFTSMNLYTESSTRAYQGVNY